jgi:hypothetical protein
MSPSIADDFPAIAIAAAINAPEAAPEPEWALGAIEPALFDLRANIGILGHLAVAENEVTADEWQHVENGLISVHARLEALWTAAWEQWKSERQAHKEALADAQAEPKTAAAGSEDDIKRAEFLWRMLRNIATITLERYDEAMPSEAAEA